MPPLRSQKRVRKELEKSQKSEKNQVKVRMSQKTVKKNSEKSQKSVSKKTLEVS